MARLTMCLAVLALFAASVAATGGVSIDLNKGDAATAPAAAAATPSTPPEATAAAPAAAADTKPAKAMPSFQMPTIQMPTIQMPTIEMPTIKKEDAPCVNKCSQECSVSMVQTCKKVPVSSKECETVTKTTTSKKCYKKCSVNIPVPAPASAPAAATAANPSAPATPAEAPAAAAPAAADAPAAPKDVTITLPNLHGKGRKLQTAHTLPFVSALLGNMHNSQPAVSCDDVTCEDVPSTSSSVECKDVTKEVQQCSNDPVKSCKEVCNCVPMQKVTVTLPGHSHPFAHMG